MIELLFIAAAMIIGAIIGIAITMKLTLNAINRADICHEDRNFIKGVLGIKQ